MDLSTHYTLCIVVDGGRVLLGEKKTGWGQGDWNAFGGRVEAGESNEQAMSRELFEEVGLRAVLSRPCGKIIGDFQPSGEQATVHLYIVSAFAGEPHESDEMRPQWFSADNLPLDRMWKGDRLWFQGVIAGKSVYGHIHYADEREFISSNLTWVDK
ncbi:MAG: hypothetical protein A3H71_00555 [Candidatus Sungbacteria bacterium RIFCSPLOWO2_02_FULL_48_13b]|uniref:Oxidized purine nucleoside triphosphate hydrolase n=1 Tax=Candidatus Sungbacteria bacterium RIFCSPLOWO2_02_FULL_48_13b TaxID=1802283 RepID=A0A1G2LEK4_9BACT|nr:MAG: hypothetical protein A3H71_00555 [Candidatus Sungbacteria bacterium RIFCSPLOWO2_02_FULL_48_13b]